MFFSRAPGERWVGRTGITTWDFLIGSFTLDAAIHQLDVSGVVPANAKRSLWYIQGSAPAAGRSFYLGPGDATTNFDCQGLISPGAGVSGQALTHCGHAGNQEISYVGTAAGWADVEIVCLGWWV